MVFLAFNENDESKRNEGENEANIEHILNNSLGPYLQRNTKLNLLERFTMA